MSVSRRNFLGFFTALFSSITSWKPARAAKPDGARVVLGHQLHNDSDVSLVETYARSLALKGGASWEAAMMFHEAQLSRERGGTVGHKLGSMHRSFVEASEKGEEAKDRSHPYWRR